MNIGFTGTREGMTTEQLLALREKLETLVIEEFHHGDCIGADKQANDLVRSIGGTTVIHAHPSNLKELRANCDVDIQHTPLPPLNRNRIIVRACDILLATPKGKEEEETRSGTWMTVRFARTAGKKIFVFMPDGAVSEEG